MSLCVDENRVKRIGLVLSDRKRPMKERFRALFTLRNIGGRAAIDCIAACLNDPSALLKHECAYCMGQMQDPYANHFLVQVLKDAAQEPMVRHEAGEALGAIGSVEVLDLLKEYCCHPVAEVAETCQLAVRRIEWKQSARTEQPPPSPYNSVDPAPPAPTNCNIAQLKKVLLDDSSSLFDRYCAMFALRNIGTEEAVLALAEGLKCGSALFRHEIAFVLGQIQSDCCINQLIAVLNDTKENEMVRHECAEALGSIANEQCTKALKMYLNDPKQVVRESCEVALDISEYETNTDFQYANTLTKDTEQLTLEVACKERNALKCD